ncbi:menaquinone-dependent protoporphyrinogen IX dehydrogenase [Propionivibrio soli]|uniref:menaquinone-dependent protoporphyrinogen IX dehydrogenase n=1 Tax=Propionivibrio soli TaxID=2976531 RepID=UPI0021E7B061|nr:menaquinone-dependent protoporphyrinogen IX dehydrogenase [Propionivibrio soli]
MTTVLILYSTTDGHTLKICRRLKECIEEAKQSGAHQPEIGVTILPIEEHAQIDLASFDKIVIGASIRYGKHRPCVFDFIEGHLPLLDSKPNAFFTVNIVARKPEKNRPDTNPYMRKFLQRTRWRPKNLAVFAGKLDYPRYGFFDRQMIRLIMLITKGPTDPATVREFTDWDSVDAFARLVRAM